MLIQLLMTAAITYAIAGFAVAIAAHARGLRRLDPAATSAPLGFRLIITPGLIALWPIVLTRIVRGTTPDTAPSLRGWSTTGLIHRITWLVAPLLVVGVIIAALGARR